MGLLTLYVDRLDAQLRTLSPAVVLSIIFVAACTITRIITEIRYAIAEKNKKPLDRVPLLVPYWIPFLGSALTLLRDLEPVLCKARDRTTESVFSYHVALSNVYFVNMPSLIQQIFTQREAVLSKHLLFQATLKAVFGYDYAGKKEHATWDAHHGILLRLLHSDFVNEASGKATKAFASKAASFVGTTQTSSTKNKPLEPWEEAGNLTVNPDGSFDVDFYQLFINYVGHTVIDVVWGKALLKNNPGLQRDLWSFDQNVHQLNNFAFFKTLTAAGRRSVALRNRLGAAMVEWHKAVVKKLSGQDPGEKWGELDDMCQIMKDHAQTWVDCKASPGLQEAADISLLLGVNVNTNKNTFWMLLHIYSRPELLQRIREEVAPYVYPRPRSEDEEPDSLPKLEVDAEGLRKNCPLIKATFFETLRMHMGVLGIRHTYQDLTLRESKQDAALQGREEPQSYKIPARSKVILGAVILQSDPRLFPEPEKFIPERFIEKDENGVDHAVLKNMFPFGGGVSKCKGRNFAEREVVVIAATLLVMWDMAPTTGDQLVLPKMTYAGAARGPLADIRVRLTRRHT